MSMCARCHAMYEYFVFFLCLSHIPPPQARISELESSLDKSKNFSSLLAGKANDAEARLAKAQTVIGELERRVSQAVEEAGLHKGQSAAIVHMLAQAEAQLGEEKRANDDLKQKVCAWGCTCMCV